MNSKSGPFIHTQPGKTSFTQYIFHEHVVHCALEIRCKTSCKKCHIHSIYLQFPYLIYAHFFVAKTIYALFCHKKNLCTLFLSRTRFTRFFRGNDLCTSSGKFLRVESCHPKSLDFLGLCVYHGSCIVGNNVLQGRLEKSLALQVCFVQKSCKTIINFRYTQHIFYKSIE